ncbi:DUF2380 domain-containing protein [Oleomonas cavernae]|uniref:DUF2380 domain-containing protein n=1 Tax=Oleomonas cavernae TaxID=2320859 RepID=A0A418VTW8_9PROT|nr:DUF2380 domain-containing protein [Oleomonas cavernae]RJF80584.1 DUF2380 domain-containing protein [Oleomonas cavernae]
MRTLRKTAIAGLFVGLTALSGTAYAEPLKILLLPFSFFDTSGEPRDQSADHARRLAAITSDLAAKIEAQGLFEVVVAPADAPPCPAGDNDCVLGLARRAGADLILTGAVQKVSTMATQLWVGAFDAGNGKRVFYNQLSFRGDTDQSWQRATAFLFDQLAADPPKKS